MRVGLTQALGGNAINIAVVLPSANPPQRLGSPPDNVQLSRDRLVRRLRLTQQVASIGLDFGSSSAHGFLPKPWS